MSVIPGFARATGKTAGTVVRLSSTARSLPAWVSLALLLVWAGVAIPSFLLPERLLILGEQVAPLALVAIGQTIVLLVGGLDLSVGQVVTLSVVLGAGLSNGSETLLPVAVVVCLAAGTAVGTLNGLLVVRLRIPPLIATIATATIVEGFAYIYTNGAPNGSTPLLLQFAANGRWGPVPVADVIMAVVLVVAFILLTRTVFGRHVYSIGANRRTAELAGVRVGLVTIGAYALCGLLAAAAGLLLAGYIAVGSLSAGDPYVLNSLAVVLIGGTSFSGGEGGVIGTFAGAAVLAVLTALLLQLSVAIALQSVLLAVIVIVAALLQGRQSRS
jgi:ribose transport system permease protein